jgi:hypothetical protein
VVQRDGVDAGVDAAAGEQRGKRRCESNARGVLGDVQRLDAQPVAAQQYPPAVALDDRKGEHALEVIDEPVAPVVVALEQDLGVAGGEEAVAVADQVLPQFLVVVDAAVPGDRQPQLRVDHGLGARLGQVDDLQATVTERDSALRPHPGAVRTPRRHRLGHGRDSGDIGFSAVETHLSGGSAHPWDITPVDAKENVP